MNRTKYLAMVFLTALIVLSFNSSPIQAAHPEFVLLKSSYSPTKVFPGDRDIQINAEIQNNGTRRARDAAISLKLPTFLLPSYEGATEQYFDEISAGESVQLTFYVDIVDHAEAGNYNIKCKIEFDDDEEESVSIPFRISGKAEWEFVKVEPYTITAGENDVELQVWILNNASVEAKDVTVQLRGGNDISGKTVDYLGNVKANETVSAFFEIDISPSVATGERELELQITWTQDDQSLSQTRAFPVYIMRPIPFTLLDLWEMAPYLTIGISVAVTVAIAIGLLVAEKRLKIREKIRRKILKP